MQELRGRTNQIPRLFLFPHVQSLGTRLVIVGRFELCKIELRGQFTSDHLCVRLSVLQIGKQLSRNAEKGHRLLVCLLLKPGFYKKCGARGFINIVLIKGSFVCMLADYESNQLHKQVF